MDIAERNAKNEAKAMVAELRQELESLNENDRVAEFDQFAVIKHDSGIVTVVALESGEAYEFMSIDTAAEFVVMNAGKFIEEEADE
jgi:O-acetylhomoserine/O-acetylserine sulfhydrylase-like pyridoxal-dependent enzyme